VIAWEARPVLRADSKQCDNAGITKWLCWARDEQLVGEGEGRGKTQAISEG